MLPCKVLGWKFKYSHKQVCGASMMTNICHKQNASYTDAVAICTSVGARLCTFNEIQNKTSHGTGCGLDYKQIWTNTICAKGHLAPYAHGKSTADKVCRVDTLAKYSVRCCADAFSPRNALSTTATITSSFAIVTTVATTSTTAAIRSTAATSTTTTTATATATANIMTSTSTITDVSSTTAVHTSTRFIATNATVTTSTATDIIVPITYRTATTEATANAATKRDTTVYTAQLCAGLREDLNCGGAFEATECGVYFVQVRCPVMCGLCNSTSMTGPSHTTVVATKLPPMLPSGKTTYSTTMRVATTFTRIAPSITIAEVETARPVSIGNKISPPRGFLRVLSLPPQIDDNVDEIVLAFEYGNVDSGRLSARIQLLDGANRVYTHCLETLPSSSGVDFVSLRFNETLPVGSLLHAEIMIALSAATLEEGFDWPRGRILETRSNNIAVVERRVPSHEEPTKVQPLQMVFDLNYTYFLASNATGDFKTRLLEEVNSGPGNWARVRLADLNTLALTIKQHGNSTAVILNPAGIKESSARVKYSFSSILKAMNSCSFCLVFRSKLLCPHAMEKSTCATPAPCRNHPCREGLVCKPDDSVDGGFYCACPVTFGVKNCSHPIRGNQTAFPPVMIVETVAEASKGHKKGLSLRDISIIVAMICLAGVSVLLLVHYFRKAPSQKKSFVTNVNRVSTYEPGKGVFPLNDTALEWEEGVWATTPGRPLKNKIAKSMYLPSQGVLELGYDAGNIASTEFDKLSAQPGDVCGRLDWDAMFDADMQDKPQPSSRNMLPMFTFDNAVEIDSNAIYDDLTGLEAKGNDVQISLPDDARDTNTEEDECLYDHVGPGYTTIADDADDTTASFVLPMKRQAPKPKCASPTPKWDPDTPPLAMSRSRVLAFSPPDSEGARYEEASEGPLYAHAAVDGRGPIYAHAAMDGREPIYAQAAFDGPVYEQAAVSRPAHKQAAVRGAVYVHASDAGHIYEEASNAGHAYEHAVYSTADVDTDTDYPEGLARIVDAQLARGKKKTGALRVNHLEIASIPGEDYATIGDEDSTESDGDGDTDWDPAAYMPSRTIPFDIDGDHLDDTVSVGTDLGTELRRAESRAMSEGSDVTGRSGSVMSESSLSWLPLQRRDGGAYQFAGNDDDDDDETTAAMHTSSRHDSSDDDAVSPAHSTTQPFFFPAEDTEL